MNKFFLSVIAAVAAGILTQPALAKDNEQVLSAYENVSTALANDDFAAAKTAAAELVTTAEEAGQENIVKQARELSTSESIDAARKTFKAVSADAVKLAEASEKYKAAGCPMVEDGKWVQSGDKLMNPYMGKKMQQCGAFVKRG